MTIILPATTLWQPWASLAAIKAKPFETRAYPPPEKYIGQRIAIHAAARNPCNLAHKLGGEVVDAICKAFHDAGMAERASWSSLPLGSVVCTAVLSGAYHIDFRIDRTNGMVGVSECRGPEKGAINLDLFGDYSPSRWAWLLTDVQPLDPPIPAKGNQGWWKWEMPC